MARGRELALLDLVDLPLAPDGPDFGFECENRSILPGRWYVAGRARAEDLRRYLSPPQPLLHTAAHKVPLAQMQALPPEERRTLQLVEAIDFAVRTSGRYRSNQRVWKGGFTTPDGGYLETTITDPLFSVRLDAGIIPAAHCLLTISLSMPWRNPDRPDDEACCWKLIAGVIELGARPELSATELAAVPF